MIYNLVSCKVVIAKIFADLNLDEDTHRVADMVEWIGEGMKKIGSFPQLVTKVAGKEDEPMLVVENYQAKLPADLHEINQVTYSTSSPTGPFYPMRYATGSYSFNNEVTLPYGTTSQQITNKDQINSQNGTTFTSDHMYNIVGGWIKTNHKEGYLLVSYQAIPVDADGYPMIPKDESFFEALYWYVNMKLTYPEWKAGKVRDAIYYDTKSSWNYYRKQAYANAMMPNTDQLEAIKNTWLRLIPEINENQTFFSTLGTSEYIFNKSRR